ncbi:MAG: hypothetical protein A2X48_12905 [Lentisphaerae bacterium GWF2_49_21]|nr:MAG: hypothetical protein A2X48_12905 [Lentisphaerae bacterium GWF2_49_21]
MAAPPLEKDIEDDYTSLAEMADIGKRVRAVVELNYYINEQEANIILNLAPGALAKGTKFHAIIDNKEYYNTIADTGETIIKIPLAKIIHGKHQVALKITANGVKLWEGYDQVVKLLPPPAGVNITQIDRNRRILVVNGKPFFPIGIIGGFKENLPQIADAGFNLTMRWRGATIKQRYDRKKTPDDQYNQKVVTDYLDAAHKAGIYALSTPVKLSDIYIKYRDSEWQQKLLLRMVICSLSQSVDQP